MLQRLQNILKQDTIHLSYLGGSVTEGFPYSEYIKQPYPDLITEILARTIPEKTFYSHNYARSGEKSSHALLASDTLLSEHGNHAIFLEYALTDDISKESVMIFESLVRKLIRRKEKPAIIVLILPAQKELLIGKFMKDICTHYGIPYMNFPERLQKHIQDGLLLPNEYWLDKTHPCQQGHQWIAEQISNMLTGYIQKEASTASPYRLAKKRFLASPYEKIKTIKLDTDITYPLTMEFHCSVLWISYIQHEESFMGNIQVFVDRELVCNLHGKSFYCWYYPVQTKLFEEKESAMHSVTFQVASGDEKKRFILEYVAYVE